MNATTKEVVVQFKEDVSLSEGNAKWVKQVHVIGDQLSGLQFTCEVNDENRYKVSVFEKLQYLGGSDHLNNGVAQLSIEYEGQLYNLIAEKDPHKKSQGEIYIKEVIAPDNLDGWSWGAFLLNWVWAIFHKKWVGLLVLLPVIGFAIAAYLGFSGRRSAWQNIQWQSAKQFNKVQKIWGYAGAAFWVMLLSSYKLLNNA